VDQVIKTPKRLRRLMAAHIPRLEAKQQILDSAVAMFPHISQESRDQQMGIWQRIGQVLGHAVSAAQEILWDGTLPDDLPKNMVVAENWDTVMNFFTKKTGVLQA
jgi:phage-related protein